MPQTLIIQAQSFHSALGRLECTENLTGDDGVIKTLTVENIRSLDVGDPNESISVPMILTTENRSFKSLIRGKREVSQQVIIRKVTRDHYRRYYAKDVEGNYVGTEKPAVDVGPVLVPSKPTLEEISRQVREVAFGREHHINDFGGAWAYGGSGEC